MINPLPPTPDQLRHEAIMRILNAVLVRLDRIDESLRYEVNNGAKHSGNTMRSG